MENLDDIFNKDRKEKEEEEENGSHQFFITTSDFKEIKPLPSFVIPALVEKLTNMISPAVVRFFDLIFIFAQTQLQWRLN